MARKTMSEQISSQTSVGGPGYVHPRSDKYRDNFDRIFRKSPCGPDCGCDESCENCCCLEEEEDQG
jgi:hypothetical protein